MATRAGSQGTQAEEEPTTKAGLPVAVTPEGLQEVYGKKEGERLYREIAIKGGFGDFSALSHTHAPALDLSGLRGEYLKAVEEVFASAKKE